MKVDLLAEATVAAARVREPELQRIEALGVPRSALARLGEHQPPFGLQAIEHTRDGLFEPVEHGPLAVVVPVMESRWINWLDTDIIEIIDLIAFYSTSPRRWYWRTGDGWSLGLDLLNHDEPILLVPDPLEWLAEAGKALCLLDWSLAPQQWARLKYGAPVFTPDELLKRRLNAAYASSVPALVGNPSQWIYRNGRYVRAA